MIETAQEDLINVRKQLSDNLPEVLNLRPLPFLAIKINQQCQNHQSNINAIIDLIQCEPATTSRILSVVNSPLYAYSREIESIKQAVVVLGFKRLAEIALSIASQTVFTKDEAVPDFGTPLYEHSLACAATARILARRSVGLVDDGAAFIAGLLHDVGKLFLFDLAPDTYMALLDTLGQSCSVEHEFALFGKSHADLGMHYAHVSGIPSSIRTAIEQHHASESTGQSNLAQTIGLANSLVKTWDLTGQGTCQLPVDAPVAKWMSETDESEQDQLRKTAEEQYGTLKSLILG